MTALISTERCVYVVFPLKVQTLLTRRRSLFLTLAVVTYHVIFTIVLYSDTGPPYDTHLPKLSFYYFVFQLNLLLAVQDQYPAVQVGLVYKKISDPFKVTSDRFK
ncbi:hypothetical protein RRG08_060321 [Elysia crispata]|uniref:Uncharacterized protein n=1 Tax=Elysia crispata TaxID=231223 RepID=A0AAE1AKX3_9GAST|nr:hypothetical protein RRG08_060321 [Elysia crispata]